MAIRIVENLSAKPNPSELPGRVTFKQVLATNRSVESVMGIYSLAEEHNVWFKEGSRNTKTVTAGASVAANGTTVEDTLELCEGTGNGPMSSIGVTKRVMDEGGLPLSDLVVLVISRSRTGP